jgi:hypothetical protein
MIFSRAISHSIHCHPTNYLQTKKPYLSLASGTPTETTERHNLLLSHDVLQVTHSSLQVHMLDCLGSLPRVLSERQK